MTMKNINITNFKEHVLDVGNSIKGRRRGSTFIKFSPTVSEEGSGLRAGQFLTLNERDHLVIHELTKIKQTILYST